jgi:gliding motility-associated protein GldC
MPRTTEIKFTVHLDDNKIPEKIEWEATDAGFTGKKETKTLFVSLWDKEENLTLAIDLWSKEMIVDEMNIHFHQIFLKLADTYRRSTNNAEAADMIEEFSADFAEKLNLKKKVPKGEPGHKV